MMDIVGYFKEIPASQRSMVVEENVIVDEETEKIQYIQLNVPKFTPRDCLTKITFTRVDSGCFVEVKSKVREDVP